MGEKKNKKTNKPLSEKKLERKKFRAEERHFDEEIKIYIYIVCRYLYFFYFLKQ